MSATRRLVLAGGAGLWAAGGRLAPAAAQDRPAPPAPPRERLPAAAVTNHVLELPGRTLRFTATAGSVALADAQGVAQMEIAFIAYTLDGAAPESRPVTFALNGGPGAASAWLQLGAVGPWRLEMRFAPSAPVRLEDNAETWLDFTDLVFIDPVGTGYSRFLTGADEVRRRAWSVGGDIDAVAGAIRRWVAQAGRSVSPKFLVGESYGGFRGPRLARTLAQSHGVGLRGMILVSPVLDFGGRGAGDPIGLAALLPTLAAAARGAAGREAVTDAEAYASGEYVADLLAGARPEAVARRSARVAALTGLDPEAVRRQGGMIDMLTWQRLAAPGKLPSLYDLDVAIADPDPYALWSRAPDAVLDSLRAPFTSGMLALYAVRLGWRLEAPYEVLNEAVNRGWDWGGGGGPRSGPESMSHLRDALALDPGLRVLVAHGLYDAVTPYFRSALLLETLVPGAGRERAALAAWPGGHMFYSRPAGRAGLRAAAEALYR